MKPSKIDYRDLTEILEGFVNNLDKFEEADLIDMAARLKPIAKHCETIDKVVKEYVKVKLKENEGHVKGNLFKAILKLTKFTRLNQAALREAHPRIAANFTDEGFEPRITFDLR